MLTPFFYTLREAGVPASVTKYLTLLEALKRGVARFSVNDFYFLARAPLGVAVVGGMLFSTALTFFVVPATYLAVERFREALAARRAGGAAPSAAAPGAPATSPGGGA